MSTVLQIIFLLTGLSLIRASKKQSPLQNYQKYIGSILLVIGIISFMVHTLK
ncbi:hypothetical protein JOD28_001410 [Leuconostoc rapi]|nr:hypothetical protein [Leuconostoc rapi]